MDHAANRRVGAELKGTARPTDQSAMEKPLLARLRERAAGQGAEVGPRYSNCALLVEVPRLGGPPGAALGGQMTELLVGGTDGADERGENRRLLARVMPGTAGLGAEGT